MTVKYSAKSKAENSQLKEPEMTGVLHSNETDEAKHADYYDYYQTTNEYVTDNDEPDTNDNPKEEMYDVGSLSDDSVSDAGVANESSGDVASDEWVTLGKGDIEPPVGLMSTQSMVAHLQCMESSL